MKRVCETCVFFGGTHWCRRYPPVVLIQPQYGEYCERPFHQAETFWPVIEPTDWCGEWRDAVPRPEPAPTPQTGEGE